MPYGQRKRSYSATKLSSNTLQTRATKRKFVKRAKGKGSPETYVKGQMFPDVFFTTLRYNSTMALINPSSASTFNSFVLNGMFDFDFDNILGNKQPLYFDDLITTSGPYNQYKVYKWNTRIHIVNDSDQPLLAYWAQAATVAETDTLLEVQNRPNVRELILDPKGGTKVSGFIEAPGSMFEIYGSSPNPENIIGRAGSNPTVQAFGTLYLYNPGGVVTTPVKAWVKVIHDFISELNAADAIVS